MKMDYGVVEIIFWGIIILLSLSVVTWVLKTVVKLAIRTALTYAISIVLVILIIMYYGNIILGAGI